MEPKIRAIDLALKLNLDEHGNPKPMPKRPLRVNTTFPSVDVSVIINNNSSILKVSGNENEVKAENFSSTSATTAQLVTNIPKGE